MQVNPRHDMTIADLLRANGERGEAVFVIDPARNERLSYAAFERQAAAVAAQLTRIGARRGERIALLLPNGPSAIVSIVGTMSAGYVAVPLDPNLARPQAVSMIHLCGARIVLCTRAAWAHVELLAADLDARVLDLETDLVALVMSEAASESATSPQPEDDAVLMYTSGSTGRPKGVLVTHAALMARVRNHAQAHAIVADDRLLCVLPLFHMSAFVLVLAVLQTGGSCVLPPRFSVAEYWNLVATYRCTWLGVVPTVVAQLLHWGESHPGPSAHSLGGVRFARCSSAPLSPEVQRAFEARFGLLLITGMGMTEAGGIFLNPPERARRKIGSLGYSCGLETRIVADDGQQTAAGEVGELLVRGAALMRGYDRDPEATARVLDADGWLRTGDRVYCDGDGFFFHAGRSKDLIIKAGTNIAPLEIEEALADHPDVLRAVAVGVPDPHLGEDIGAFVLPRAHARCSARALMDHCEARLGEFKTPSWIRFVDALPTGSSGKVLRAELAARAAEAGDAPATDSGLSSAADDDVESVIRAVWAEVLERPSVVADANFFALGGTSLLALRVTTRLRRRLLVQISLPMLLGAPTVTEQSALVRTLRRAAPSGAATLFEAGTRDEEKAAAVLLSPVDPARTDLPLFCVYHVSAFLPLAQTLGPRHPVYGVAIGPAIAAIEGANQETALARLSVEDLARVCVEEIRRVQPHGPYQLGGFSFGGRVALEIAQQLGRAGEDVRLLVIFDTFMPGAFRRRPLRWLAYHAARVVREGPRYLQARQRPKPIDDETPALGPSDAMQLLARREGEFRRAVGGRYVPRSFAGQVVLFRAAHNRPDPHYRADPLLGWGRIASRLRVHEIAARHLEILDQRFSAEIAGVLQTHLQRPTGPDLIKTARSS